MGFQVLLNSLSLLIDMVRFSNLAIRLVMGLQQDGNGAKVTKYIVNGVKVKLLESI